MAKKKTALKKAPPKKASTKKAAAKSRGLVSGVIKGAASVVRAMTAGTNTDIRFGTVNSDGTVANGGSTDWSVVRNSVGRYTITFTGGMPVPAVTVTPVVTTVTHPVLATSPTANTCVVLIHNNAGNLQDVRFSFIAIGKVPG